MSLVQIINDMFKGEKMEHKFKLGQRVKIVGSPSVISYGGYKGTISSVHDQSSNRGMMPYTVAIDQPGAPVYCNYQENQLVEIKQVHAYAYKFDSGVIEWRTYESGLLGMTRMPEFDFVKDVEC